MKYLNQLSTKELETIFERVGLKILDEDFEETFEYIKQNNINVMYVRCLDTKFDVSQSKQEHPLECLISDVLPADIQLYLSNACNNNKDIYSINDFGLCKIKSVNDAVYDYRDRQINIAFEKFMKQKFKDTDYQIDKRQYFRNKEAQEKEI